MLQCNGLRSFLKGMVIIMKNQVKRLLAVVMTSAIAVTGLNAAPASALSRPSFTVTKRAKTTASIKITKVKKATGYQIFLANSRKGKFRQVGATRTTSFQFSKLKKNKAYYVKVRAYKTKGNRIVTGKYSATTKIKKYSVPSRENKQAQVVLNLVNQERSAIGAEALMLDDAVNKVADGRAKELAEKFSHTRPDGRDCFTALTEAGIVYSSCGENIAMGQTTAEEVMNSWMNSDGHRANILSSDYTKMGVGYYYDKESNQHYWVQMFIKE